MYKLPVVAAGRIDWAVNKMAACGPYWLQMYRVTQETSQENRYEKL